MTNKHRGAPPQSQPGPLEVEHQVCRSSSPTWSSSASLVCNATTDILVFTKTKASSFNLSEFDPCQPETISEEGASMVDVKGNVGGELLQWRNLLSGKVVGYDRFRLGSDIQAYGGTNPNGGKGVEAPEAKIFIEAFKTLFGTSLWTSCHRSSPKLGLVCRLGWRCPQLPNCWEGKILRYKVERIPSFINIMTVWWCVLITWEGPLRLDQEGWWPGWHSSCGLQRILPGIFCQ